MSAIVISVHHEVRLDTRGTGHRLNDLCDACRARALMKARIYQRASGPIHDGDVRDLGLGAAEEFAAIMRVSAPTAERGTLVALEMTLCEECNRRFGQPCTCNWAWHKRRPHPRGMN